MQHSRYPFAVKSVLFSVFAAALSGCSTLWNIDEDAPPPPPVREVRQLRVPGDLMNPARFSSNPYTVATAQAAPQPTSVTLVPVPAEENTAPVPADQFRASAILRNTNEQATFFAPYFPTEPEKHSPQQWELRPAYAFPWIAGAEPSRVNEETVLGAGERMIGRFFATVSFKNKIPLPALNALSVPVTSTKEIEFDANHPVFLVRMKNKLTALAENSTGTAEQFVQCDGATCLDAARDALAVDAIAKGWEMLLNRRVSMHQSFQFRKNDRIVLIEVSSDGKKKLDIEYALLPTQINAAGN